MCDSPDHQSQSGIVPPTAVSTANQHPQRPVGWGELYTDSWLHRGHHAGKEMVWCLHCAGWMHAVCIALQEEYNPGSWVCFTCRKLPYHVATLTKDMARLVEMVQGMTSYMTRLQEQHDRAIAKADERHQKLTAENEDLRQCISDLSRQASSDHWCQLKSSHGTVVIGSSIIRDISEEKLVATQCICRRGGVIKDLQEALDSLQTEKPFSRIILIGGGNDCDTDNDDIDASGITAQYKDLVECAKGKATNVTMCSVCPHHKTPAVSQRIESLNAGLKGIASDLGVDFLNNDPIFHLQDGTLNDGYLLADGVHLTRPTSNRLVANMQLSLRQGETCAYRDHRRKNLAQDSPAHTTVGDGGDNYTHPFWQKAIQKAYRWQPEDSDLLSALPLPTGHSRQLDLQWFKVALSLTQSLYPVHNAGTLNSSSAHPPDRWRHVSLDKAKWPCPMPHTRPIWWTFPYSRHFHPNNRGLMTFPRTPSPDLRSLPMPQRIPRTHSASYNLAGDTRLSRARAGSVKVLHVPIMVIWLVHAHKQHNRICGRVEWSPAYMLAGPSRYCR